MKNLQITPVLLLAFLFSLQPSFAQERTNRKLPKISSTIVSQLTTATGWILNPEGQWVSRKNRIPQFLENQFKILMDHEAHGLGMDNFISYQLREIRIADSSYYVLLKKYRDGYYRYPSIQRDWNSTTSFFYYVFSKEEYHKLDSIQDNEINFISLQLVTHGAVEFSNLNTYLLDIEKEISKSLDQKDYGDTQLVFHIAPFKKKGIVQFQIYGWQSDFKSTTGIRQEHKPPKPGGLSIYDSKDIYPTDEVFKHCYYETEYKVFKSFLKMN